MKIWALMVNNSLAGSWNKDGTLTNLSWLKEIHAAVKQLVSCRAQGVIIVYTAAERKIKLITSNCLQL